MAALTWSAWAATELAAAAIDARAGRQHAASALGADWADLTDGAGSPDLRSAGREFRSARRHLDSPALFPIRAVPLVGRQVESLRTLTGGSARLAVAAEQALTRTSALTGDGLPAGADRVTLLREASSVVADVRAATRDIDAGPSSWLLPPLAGASREFRRELADLEEQLDRGHVAVPLVASLLEGPRSYLLVAANNAEMRNGSGMFLQAGVLRLADGRVSVDRLSPVWQRLPPAGAVRPTGDIADRWGWLHPGDDFRNLALSPRFDRSAAMAADLWAAGGNPPVDGVLLVDPVALQSILAAVGAIEVDGDRLDASNVVDDLLRGQYERSLARGVSQEERRDRLAEVAATTVSRLEAGGGDVGVLLSGLADAVAGRHLMAWSRHAGEQRLWRTLGASGDLADRSMLVSVLNRGGGRGGGKLDPRLAIAARLSSVAQGRQRRVVVDLTIRNTVAPGEKTYVEAEAGRNDVEHGVYRGIVAVTLPRDATEASLGGRPLSVAGPDGRNRVVATRVVVHPQQEERLRLSFSLPTTYDWIRVEPSARVPATVWTSGRDRWEDAAAHVVQLAASRQEER